MTGLRQWFLSMKSQDEVEPRVKNTLGSSKW